MALLLERINLILRVLELGDGASASVHDVVWLDEPLVVLEVLPCLQLVPLLLLIRSLEGVRLQDLALHAVEMGLGHDRSDQILLGIRGWLPVVTRQRLVLYLVDGLVVVADSVQVLAVNSAQLRLLHGQGGLVILCHLTLVNQVPEVLHLLLVLGLHRVRGASQVLLTAMAAVVALAVDFALFVADLDAPQLRIVVSGTVPDGRVRFVVVSSALNTL